MPTSVILPDQAAAPVVTSPQPSPVSRADRIEAIDALRGIALFGVLTVNLVLEFRVSLFAQFLPEPVAGEAWDRLVTGLVSAGFEMKAFALFSLLFGVGLAIQFERLEGRPDRLKLLLRRMAALLLFGLIHLFLIWNGDILTEYAVVGLLVVPLLFAPTWVLGGVAAVSLVVFGLMPLVPPPVAFPSPAWILPHLAQAHAAYGHGDYLKVVAFNIGEVPAILPLHLLVLPRTLGLFALGAWLWRTGVLRTGGAGLFAGCAALGLGVGVVLTVASGTASPGVVGRIAGQAAPVVLAFGYAAVVLALGRMAATRRLVAWAAPLGRTAFTNYLLQSAVFGWIFFGYGLGLFDRLGPAQAFVLGLGVYAVQAVASTLWLRRFRFGPVEWLWRAMMYGRWPAMRREAG